MKDNVIIGYGAESEHNHCVVIGAGAKSTEDNQIVLGTETVTATRKLTDEEFDFIKDAFKDIKL